MILEIARILHVASHMFDEGTPGVTLEVQETAEGGTTHVLAFHREAWLDLAKLTFTELIGDIASKIEVEIEKGGIPPEAIDQARAAVEQMRALGKNIFDKAADDGDGEDEEGDEDEDGGDDAPDVGGPRTAVAA